jgi:hypothetical protein
VFVAEITDEFILGLDVLLAYDTSVELGRHLLRLGQEELTLWNSGARPTSSRHSLVSDEVVPARCEWVVMARLEAHLGAANVLVEPSLKTSREGLYIAWTLFRSRPRVPARIMNVTNQDQVLGESTTIGHGEPVTCAASLDDQEQQPRRTRGLSKEHKDMMSGSRPNLNKKEANILEDFVAEFQDFFATKSGDYGGKNKVYHRIDTGDARPIRQPPRRRPLARGERHAGRYEETRSYLGVGQPLVVPRRGRPEEERRPAIPRGIEEVERCHQEGLLTATKDRRHLGYANRRKVVFYIGLEKRLLAGGLTS